MKPGLLFAVTVSAMPPMPRRLFLLLPAVLLAGCIHVKMDPIQVHAVVDVNVKIDKALDDFFGDLDKKSTTLTPDRKS
jgi:hypothetical protein